MRSKQSLKTREEKVASPSSRRKYIGILFECCDVYARVYVNKKKKAYIGWCPKCTHRIEIKIGKGGTDSRFFRAEQL
jgi:hypothetical protein